MKKTLTKLLFAALFINAVLSFTSCDKLTDDPGDPGKTPVQKEDKATDINGDEFVISSCSISFKNYTYSQYGSSKIIFAGKYTKNDFTVEVQDFLKNHKADVTDKAEIFVNNQKLTDDGIEFEHSGTYTIYAVYKAANKEYTSQEYKDIFAAKENDLVKTVSENAQKTVEGFCVQTNYFGTYQYVTKSEGKLNLTKMDTSEVSQRAKFSVWVGESLEKAQKIDCDIMGYKFKSTDKVIVLALKDEAALSSEKAYGVIPVTVYPVSKVNSVVLGRADRSLKKGETLSGTTWNFENIYNSYGDFVNLIALTNGAVSEILARYYFTDNGVLADGVEQTIYETSDFTGTPVAVISNTAGTWTPDKAGTYYVQTKITNINGSDLVTPVSLQSETGSTYSVHKIVVTE